MTTASDQQNKDFDAGLETRKQVMGEDFVANAQGNLSLTWQGLAGAKKYFISLKDSQGQNLSQQNLPENETEPSIRRISFSDLMPGSYQVEIYALDSYGRKSNVDPPRKLSVPDNSGLSAPKLKKVKVNDDVN